MGLTMMELREGLEGWTVEAGRAGARRSQERSEAGVLRVERIGGCELRIYEEMMGRDGGGVFRALNLYEAGLHKRDMVGRLVDMGVLVECQGLMGFDGRVVGEPEGVLRQAQDDDRVLMIKPVRSDWFDEAVRRRGPLNLHFDQAQLYMDLGGFEEAVVLYKSRERGKVFPVYVRADGEKQGLLGEKVLRVLGAYDEGVAPGCTCGRCGG